MNKTAHVPKNYLYNPDLLTNIRSALVLIILCGGLYPLITTLIGGWLFPHQATGSLIYRDGKTIGSELVGQQFSSAHYFYGRPSAAGYNPFSVSGSNLSPNNPVLTERATADSRHIQQAEGTTADQIPIDLVTASGSGIDPHISPESALLQVDRVARTRGIAIDTVTRLVNENTESPQWGIFGQPRVNVLKLNLALDYINQTQ